MQISRTVKATACVIALVVHAGFAMLLYWQTSSQGTSTANTGRMSISLGQIGQTTALAATEVSKIQEVQMVTAPVVSTRPNIAEAASVELSATARPVKIVQTREIVKTESKTAPVFRESTPRPVSGQSPIVPKAPPVPIKSVTASAMAATHDSRIVSAIQPLTSPNIEVSPAPAPSTRLSTRATAMISVERGGAIEQVASILPDTHTRTVPKPDRATVAQPERTHSPAEVEKPELPTSVSPEPMPGDRNELQPIVMENEVKSTSALRNVELVPSQRVQQASVKTLKPAKLMPMTPVIPPSINTNTPSRQSAVSGVSTGEQADSVGNSAARKKYLRKLLSHIMGFKRYPRQARRDGIDGKVTVRFTVLSNGSLESTQLAVSSGDARLDQAALTMLSRANPFPPFPQDMGENKLELNLPVQFLLSRRRSHF